MHSDFQLTMLREYQTVSVKFIETLAINGNLHATVQA